MKIYDSTDIKLCFQAIKRDDYLWKFSITNPNFDEAQRIIFDLRNKYLAVVSTTQIIFFSLIPGNTSNEPLMQYTVNDNYEKIFDCIIDSKKPTVAGSNFNCVVACK